MNRGLMAALLVGAACLAVPATGQSGDDTNRIIDEGYNRSQVMQTAQEMTDGIGPRLTNSPAMRRAEAWALVLAPGGPPCLTPSTLPCRP